MISLHYLDKERSPQWEWLRRLRNSCRHLMTNDTRYITVQEQEAFRTSFDPDKQAIYLLSTKPDVYVGYLYLREVNGVWKPSYVVHEDMQGSGIGSILVSLSQVLVPRLQLEVWTSNKQAWRLYFMHGFIPTSLSDETITMEWRRANDFRNVTSLQS